MKIVQLFLIFYKNFSKKSCYKHTLGVSLGIEINKTKTVMLTHFLISNILFPYLITGVIIAIAMDILIRILGSSKPFTFGDIWACILFWPIMVTGFIKGYTNN